LINQTHATQFAGDIDPRNVGLEGRLEQRNIQSAPFRAEYQRDSVERTHCLAGAVSDALGWPDQYCLAIDEPQDFMMRCLRAGFHARATAQTSAGVDLRMQRCRLRHPSCNRFLMGTAMAFVDTPLPPKIDDEGRYQGQCVDGERPRFHDSCAQVSPNAPRPARMRCSLCQRNSNIL
jgi:hypothetical protein